MKQKNTNWPALLFLVIPGSLLMTGCGGKTTPRVLQVGILYGTPNVAAAIDGFKDKMTELGYIEGKHIAYDIQLSDITPALNRQLADKFVKNKVDLIFAFPVSAALGAKAATAGTDIPVIFTISGLEGINLVDSVRAPGGNITGVRSPITELPSKSFEIMLELVPGMKRLYVPYAADYPSVSPGLAVLHTLAESAGVMLIQVPVTTLDELAADLEAREAAQDIGLDAIQLLPENLVQSSAGLALLDKFTAKHKIPMSGTTPSILQQGAVFVCGLNMYEMGRLAAPLADKVLKGTKAGTIPVVSPDLYLRINYKRPQELGLIVPEGLLLEAVEIIR